MLEQEIKRFTEGIYEETFGSGQNTPDEFDWEDIASVIEDTAKHFAEWGEKNAHKVIMKKADEVRDKMFDTDYEVKIEPAAGFDFGCVNVYHEGKLVGQYVEPKEEKKLPEGLEEAAEKWATTTHFEWPNQVPSGKEGFIAGAEWQKKLDDLETEDLLAIAHLQGMEQQKAKMMEDAVEGVAEELYNDGESQCTVGVGTYFKPGEEVYVIKKEEQE